MSKIIRSTNAQQPEDSSIVEIKLQNFFEPIHYGKTEDERIEELSQQKTIDIEAERQQMLAQANDEIEQKNVEFEQYRKEQLAEIEALKQSWEEEKIILQQEAYEGGFAQGYEDGVQKANATMQQSLQTANETMANAQKMQLPILSHRRQSFWNWHYQLQNASFIQHLTVTMKYSFPLYDVV